MTVKEAAEIVDRRRDEEARSGRTSTISDVTKDKIAALLSLPMFVVMEGHANTLPRHELLGLLAVAFHFGVDVGILLHTANGTERADGC